MDEYRSFSPESPSASPGFGATLVKKLHLDSLWESLKNSQDLLINVGIAAGIGIIMGFLFKRYGSFFITLALVIAAFVVLVQFDLLFVTINWSKAYNLAGFTQSEPITSENFFMTLWEWIKNNVQLVVSGIIGFLMGLKIG